MNIELKRNLNSKEIEYIKKLLFNFSLEKIKYSNQTIAVRE